MISVLTRLFGAHNLELAEDVVQASFVAALETWGKAGEASGEDVVRDDQLRMIFLCCHPS